MEHSKYVSYKNIHSLYPVFFTYFPEEWGRNMDFLLEMDFFLILWYLFYQYNSYHLMTSIWLQENFESKFTTLY